MGKIWAARLRGRRACCAGSVMFEGGERGAVDAWQKSTASRSSCRAAVNRNCGGASANLPQRLQKVICLKLQPRRT